MPDDIDQAIALHQSGQVAAARAIYERILAADPGRSDALQLLGVIAQQEGRHDEAARLISAAVRHEPGNAAYRSNLGLALRSLGRRDEAIRELREAVRLDPAYAVAARNLATLLAEAGDPAAAEAALVAACAADPRDVPALRRLGLARARAGRLAEAVGPLETAARLEPADAATLNNLGIVLKDLGRLVEAEDVLRRAVAAAPGSADATNSLALVLMARGLLDEAERVMRAGLAIAGDHVDLLNNLAVLLKQLGRQAEGEPLLRRVLARTPDDPGGLVNMGDLLVAAGRAEEALPLLEQAVRLAPRSPEACNNLALALKALDRDEEATPHLEAALALAPGYLPAIHNLGNNLVAIGRVAEGVGKFLEVLDRDPGNFPALYSLATVTDHPLGDEALGRIQALLARPDLAIEARQLLHMAAAAAHDRTGDHDAGVVHAIESGRLRRALDRRAGRGFFRDRHVRLVAALEETFAAAAVPALATSGLDTAEPLFVVGMPRSGTTLVEQILASHPLVHGAGETDEIAEAALALGGGWIDGADAAAYPRCLARCDAAALAAAAAGILGRYRESAARGRTGAEGAGPARIVDKTTINFLHVGLIALLFPRARIIHTLRDPRDTCISCLFHNFTGAGLNFTNDLGDLGLVHRLKDRLMAHWHAVFPGRILDVPYEALVDDGAGWTRRMLDHAGLAWSDTCLDFHRLDRRVKTASNLQVRKPLYRGSVARWKRYERHLAPLLDALAGRDGPEPDEPPELSARAVAAAAGRLAARPQSRSMSEGIAAHAAGRHAEAVALFRRAVAEHPDDPKARLNLGVALKDTGATAEAEAAYRQALAMAPRFAAAHNNLGILLTESGRQAEALASFEEALRHDPGHADARHNRGAILAELHRHEEAIPEFHAAIAADAACAEYHNSLGASLAVLGNTTEALASYERALALDENHAWAHFNRSQAWLLQGDWRRGFAEWEWRKRLPKTAARGWTAPEWRGAALPAGTVLVHCEQGLGDTLQFIRFVRHVAARVGRVVVECQAPLVPLLSRCDGIAALVAKGEPLPPHDAQVALLSLPHVLGLDGADLAAESPYLTADPGLVAAWGEVLGRLPGRRIGIAWQGNPKYKRDVWRSVPLVSFAPVAAVPGVTLVSLQQGPGRTNSGQFAAGGFPVVDLGPEVDTAAGAFMDTAAIMRGLDLVITSDTSIPHLAGGLGVPVW
ncbi:MAG: tetratricopeptide repeat protein, partial [Planctomycetia bacterium]